MNIYLGIYAILVTNSEMISQRIKRVSGVAVTECLNANLDRQIKGSQIRQFMQSVLLHVEVCYIYQVLDPSKPTNLKKRNNYHVFLEA